MVKRKVPSKKKDKGSGFKGGGDAGDTITEPQAKVAKTQAPKSKIDTSAITTLSQQIVSAFQSKYSTSTKTNYQLLNECDENSTMERALWPWFLHSAMSSSTESSNYEQTPPVIVAFALAILSNRRAGGTSADDVGSGGGGGGDPRLWFVVDDYDYSSATKDTTNNHHKNRPPPTTNFTSQQRTIAFSMLLKLLLKYQEIHTNNNNHQQGREQLDSTSIATKTEIVKFFISSYASMELRCSNTTSLNRGAIEGPLTDLVGIRLWDAIPTRKRHLEMNRDGLLRKRYGLFVTKRKEENVGFLPSMVGGLLNVIATLGADGMIDDGNEDKDMADGINCDEKLQKLMRGYAAKILELLLDLLSYPQTRTHVAPYLSARHLVVQMIMSKLYKQRRNESFVLIRQQIDMLLDSEHMEVATSIIPEAAADNVYNGISSQQVHQRAHTLQKLLHRHHLTETSEVIFAGVARVCDSKWLRAKIDLWKDETLYDVCYRLRLVDDNEEGDYDATIIESSAEQLGCTRRELLTAILLYHFSWSSDAAKLSAAPLYPTERLLWDEHSLPSNTSHSTESSLSLPKLNTRFLSPGDYLLRNFKLFQLESAYEIRGDIVDVVKRMRPARTADGYAHDDGDYYGSNQQYDDMEGESKTCFQGWARMGLELGSKKKDKPGLRLIRVDPPRIGERVPSQVIAEIVLDLHHCATSLAKEWDEIGEFDNLFLVNVDATQMTGDAAPLTGMVGKDGVERRVPDEEDCTFPRRYGIGAVRGCMVLEVRDEAGVLSGPALAYEEGGKPEPKGKIRFLRVALDPAQYASDASRGSALGTDVYESFNLVVRRHGRENNFKAVLETIRGLLQGGANSMYRSIPSWLMPVALGYGGDPSLASYSSPKMKEFALKTTGVTSPDAALDYGDTFLGMNHLRDSFEGCELTVDGKNVASDSKDGDSTSERKKYRLKIVENKVDATSYPFPSSYSGNEVRFTPVQVKAIRSGLSPGLTTIIGPPGTGKTDVAVQIIANLYHSFPTQRTVIVTHSNAALNDIFDKVMTRGDVDERYMLRLGSGEKNLTTTSSSEHDFTKVGRVAHIMSRRGDLLEKVQQLSEALGVSGKAERGADGAPSYTSETSEYFFFHHVKPRIDSFEKATLADKGEGTNNVISTFPFTQYFPELTETSTTLSPDAAMEKISQLKAVFTELAEYRPIELLRSQRQRTDYLLTSQAKIVAMTCTHAAIARSHLVDLGFHYDNVIMEEAGQMLDVETFVPLLLQRGESDSTSAGSHSRLKRVCLIGDHNQLPPVVKNQSFSRYSHYDQSCFARLIRLGVPSIELDKQGRSRPEIARLFSWRYDDLGDLGHVSTKDVFKRANTGLALPYQLINVEDFEGRGESTPTAYFYQNIGEAEYAIALFQYMVLIGYPPERISILTTYNGQKELILDILAQRCGEGTPLSGVRPGAVSTVDQYQGQQNDYIILSLVRTKAVGHIRDIRRLVVAVSRARLGLYVFCRSSLFCSCHELRRTMDQFANRPSKLQLVQGEHFPTERKVGDKVERSNLHEVKDVTEMGALVHSMQCY